MVSLACPICRRPSTKERAPFCSSRCRDVDLQRWFSGAYAVPSSQPEDDDGPPAPPLPDDDEA